MRSEGKRLDFCGFDEGAAVFDATPVENMFITEYMLRAPGDFVKVYLYGLMLCYHPAQRMSVAAMARDLDQTEEDVMRAFKYWAREGLVRQIGDNPVRFAFVNLKQMTLTRAENPGEQLYNRHFTEEIRRILDKQTVGDNDYKTIFDWVDVLELPEEVVLMLLQTERQSSTTGRVSMKIADRRALEWAQRGVKTVEDVEKIVLIGKEREGQLRKLLARLGQRRAPSEDEKAMYTKWVDDWGFTPEAVQEACRETTKGTPTMAYLDGILLRQHQLGRYEAAALTGGLGAEKTERGFARDVLRELGRTGVTPTDEDIATIQKWKDAGSGEDLILLAAQAAHKRAGGGNFEDIENWLGKWQKRGLRTADAVRADSARIRMLNAQLREIYETAGIDKRTNAADRDLLCRWAGEMNMSAEMILLAAQYARGSGAPMPFIGRILSNWQRAGISTIEAAQREHEAHVGKSGAQTAQGGRGETLMRHNYTEADYRGMVVDLDEEEN